MNGVTEILKIWSTLESLLDVFCLVVPFFHISRFPLLRLICFNGRCPRGVSCSSGLFCIVMRTQPNDLSSFCAVRAAMENLADSSNTVCEPNTDLAAHRTRHFAVVSAQSVRLKPLVYLHVHGIVQLRRESEVNDFTLVTPKSVIPFLPVQMVPRLRRRAAVVTDWLECRASAANCASFFSAVALFPVWERCRQH